MQRHSPCKVNLILNILGRRPDGFHALETVMQPLGVHDTLTFARGGAGVELTCSHSSLPTDATNLVHRAANAFLAATRQGEGVRIHLDKRLPLAAGLGGGSANAACTLRALNELFERPLTAEQLEPIAASLGSDVPFFLQDGPALATGRGEVIRPLPPFPALRECRVVLVHPGFGVSTAWAYGQLARHPEALHGQAGRAEALVQQLQSEDWPASGAGFYNSLEAPALKKYPILQLYQDFFREQGALATLMSGSGSTTFAIVRSQADGEALIETFRTRFGGQPWTAIASLGTVPG